MTVARKDFIRSIADLIVFEDVVKAGSFEGAVSDVGDTDFIIRTVLELEKKYGSPLLIRGEIGVSPTEAGQKVLDSMVKAMDLVSLSHAELGSSETAFGMVRISSSCEIASRAIKQRLTDLRRLHPGIVIDLAPAHGENIIPDGCDAALVAGLHRVKDLNAVRIAEASQYAVVASQNFLAGRVIDTPDDLLLHECIAMRDEASAEPPAWVFAKDGRKRTIRPNCVVQGYDPSILIDVAISDGGLLRIARDHVARHIEDGVLREVLEDYSTAADPVFLYYRNFAVPRKPLLSVIEFLRIDAKSSL